jgi:hypothetical protein
MRGCRWRRGRRWASRVGAAPDGVGLSVPALPVGAASAATNEAAPRPICFTAGAGSVLIRRLFGILWSLLKPSPSPSLELELELEQRATARAFALRRVTFLCLCKEALHSNRRLIKVTKRSALPQPKAGRAHPAARLPRCALQVRSPNGHFSMAHPCANEKRRASCAPPFGYSPAGAAALRGPGRSKAQQQQQQQDRARAGATAG